MGRFAIQRIAHPKQFLKFGPCIALLKQGPGAIVPQPVGKIVGAGAQIDHRTPFAQGLAVLRPQHSSTPGGQHDAVTLRQSVNGARFDVAKPRLAKTRKKGCNRAALLALDLMVTVDELKAGALCERPANSCFSSAH